MCVCNAGGHIGWLFAFFQLFPLGERPGLLRLDTEINMSLSLLSLLLLSPEWCTFPGITVMTRLATELSSLMTLSLSLATLLCQGNPGQDLQLTPCSPLQAVTLLSLEELPMTFLALSV